MNLPRAKTPGNTVPDTETGSATMRFSIVGQLQKYQKFELSAKFEMIIG
jgi:hypothetical protein